MDDVVIVVHPPAGEATLTTVRRVLKGDGRFPRIRVIHPGCAVAWHCGPNTICVMFLRRGDHTTGGHGEK